MAERRKGRRALGLLVVTGLLTGSTWALPVRGETSVLKHQRAAAGLEVAQVADADSSIPGLTIGYTITARNSGTATLTGAALKADLAKMLDDADYNDDAAASTGALSYAEPALAWKGDLPAGETATITYSVTISDPAQGDHELASAVSSDTPGSTCTSAKPCVTEGTVARLLDYGDAPESFDGGEDGPSHEYSTKLGIGSAKSSDDADSDSAEADADEGDDGVRTFPPMSPAMTEYTLDVAVTNATADDATLGGWIDANGDGDFDQDERAIARVPAGATSATLHWTGLKGLRGLKGKATFVRLRLFEGVGKGLRRAKPPKGFVVVAVGFGGKGEVEDYKVTVTGPGVETTPTAKPQVVADTSPLVQFKKVANLKTAKPGAKIVYTVFVSNNTATTQEVEFVDRLDDVLDDAVLNKKITASIGKAERDGNVLAWDGTLKPYKTAVINYSVTMRQQKTGDGVLENEIVGVTDVRQNCKLDSGDDDCYATVYRAKKSRPSGGGTTPVTPSGTLARTGAPIEDMVRVALLLLVFGSVVAAGASVRRRSRA